jgi:hypothetical protein
MKLKLGFFVGIALGYYFGSMAGRERYEQLNRVLRKARRSGPVDAATDQARSAVDSGYQKAKDRIRHKMSHNGNSQPNQFSAS